MPKLDLKKTVLSQAPEVTLLNLRGTLELATLPELEKEFSQLAGEGRFKVVVDMEGLEYISSSGLGSFLGALDSFREKGGDLVFIRLSSKIAKIFQVVGFMKILKVFPGLDEGIHHFGAGTPGAVQRPVRFEIVCSTLSPHSGEPFNLEIYARDAANDLVTQYHGRASLKAAWGILSPAEATFQNGAWFGKAVLTGPGTVRFSVSDSEGAFQGEASLDVVETKLPAAFPADILCPGCHHPLQAPSAEIFRCNICNEVFMVDRWAHVISLRAGKLDTNPPALHLQLTFPADVNLLAPVRRFLVHVLKENSYADDFINDMEMSADEAITNIVEHAYQYDPTKNISMRLSMEKDQVTLILRDNGVRFDPSQLPEVDIEQHIRQRKTGGLGRFLMKQFMDSIEYQASPEGNSLCMVKKISR